MCEINKMKELMQTIIGMHESREFDALLPYVSNSEIEKETWLTRKRFNEVCEAIENEIGKMTSLQYIDALKRKSSILTLWKATYSKTKDEVLWQVTFDAASNKVKLMHINWEHQVGLME